MEGLKEAMEEYSVGGQLKKAQLNTVFTRWAMWHGKNRLRRERYATDVLKRERSIKANLFSGWREES